MRAVALALALFAFSTGTASAAERHFAPTDQTARGAFLDFFDAYGGLDLFGYPRTGEFLLNGRTVQYFQRARMEWWPENPPGHQVQLGLLSDELGKSRPPSLQSADPTRRYFRETQHSIGGAFREFWETRGGLAAFGYPISDDVQEGGFTVQYFQRARFEWHGENPPRYRVQLGLLGDEQIAVGGVSVPEASAPRVPLPAPLGVVPGGPGNLVMSTGAGGPFYVMNPDGSGAVQLGRGVDPSLSPDGTKVVFGLEDVEKPGMYVQAVSGGPPTRIFDGKGVRGPLYSPDGSEIAFYQRSDCIREVRGEFFADVCYQVKVLPAGGGVDWLPPGQGKYAQTPTWSPDGKRIIYKEEKALFVVSRDGTSRQLSEFNPLYRTPNWSPRGGKVAVSVDRNRTHREIGLIPDDGSVDFQQLTHTEPFVNPPSTSLSPSWSPDGTRIAFVSNRDGALRLWVMDGDGSNPVRLSHVELNAENADERLVHWGAGRS